MEGHLERIGELNEIVRRGDLPFQITRDEALHSERIIRIAERIATQVPVVRLVPLAGPSSAGKTTTAIRLCTRLRENGIEAMRISTDDYFVGDDENPRDENGNLDYEHIGAVDSRRLIADLTALMSGETIHPRRFDFETHTGYDAEETVSLPPRGIVVLEGIHALNPALTAGILEEVKFRVYINVFTTPMPDSSSAFFAEDVRLLRRIVRDSANRNVSASATLARWPSVEAGERRWIDPYRRLADAVFNSGLDYELAVLRPYAHDLLLGVDDGDPNYREAVRLETVLASIAEGSSEGVPGNSILRETIGGSHLEY